jgi:hypothetical protein
MNGRVILATLVDEQLWRQIHQVSNAPEITMRCCGRRAVAVLNDQGTRFFRHKAGSVCGAKVKSPEWRRVMSSLGKGATRAGFSPDPLWNLGGKVSACVRATKAEGGSTLFALLDRRIAPIEAAPLVARAAAKDSTIVWLGTRHATASLATTTEPTFVVNQDSAEVASVKGSSWISAESFAHRWLTGRIGYATRARPAPEQLCTFATSEGFCRTCREMRRALNVLGAWRATCGRPLWTAHLRDLGADNPDVLAAAADSGSVARFEPGAGWRPVCSVCSSPLVDIKPAARADQGSHEACATLTDEAHRGMRDPHWCVADCCGSSS